MKTRKRIFAFVYMQVRSAPPERVIPSLMVRVPLRDVVSDTDVDWMPAKAKQSRRFGEEIDARTLGQPLV